MPVYLGGYVFANATVRYGSGFTVGRRGSTGSYRITIPAAASTKFFVPIVTPAKPNTVAWIVLVQKDALTGNFLIDIEIHDLTAPFPLIDGDFSFIALERS